MPAAASPRPTGITGCRPHGPGRRPRLSRPPLAAASSPAARKRRPTGATAACSSWSQQTDRGDGGGGGPVGGSRQRPARAGGSRRVTARGGSGSRWPRQPAACAVAARSGDRSRLWWQQPAGGSSRQAAAAGRRGGCARPVAAAAAGGGGSRRRQRLGKGKWRGTVVGGGSRTRGTGKKGNQYWLRPNRLLEVRLSQNPFLSTRFREKSTGGASQEDSRHRASSASRSPQLGPHSLGGVWRSCKGTDRRATSDTYLQAAALTRNAGPSRMPLTAKKTALE